jgi:CHASE3 domain sensor protein
MAELTLLISLTGHEDTTVAWAAQQALQIAQSRAGGEITPDEAVEALQDLQKQTDLSMAADAIENRANIDDAISALITVVGAVY